MRLPHDLGERLTRLADATHRPKSYYVRELLEQHLAELEYVAGIDAKIEAVRRGEVPTRPFDDLLAEVGITPEDLQATRSQSATTAGTVRTSDSVDD